MPTSTHNQPKGMTMIGHVNEPTDPLSRFTTAEILAEITSRPGGPEALRAAFGPGQLNVT